MLRLQQGKASLVRSFSLSLATSLINHIVHNTLSFYSRDLNGAGLPVTQKSAKVMNSVSLTLELRANQIVDLASSTLGKKVLA